MVSAMSALLAIVTIVGMLQMCPAPPLAIGLAGAVAEGAVTGIAGAVKGSKRDLEVLARGIPPGVPQYNFEMCTAAVNKQHANGGSVKLSDLGEGCKCSACTSMRVLQY